MMPFWECLWRDCRGGPIVELAVLAPLLVSLGLGVNEFGNAVQNYHVIDKGVRDAARYLGKGFATCDANGNGSVSNTTQAQNLALYGNTAGTGTAVLSYWANLAQPITASVSCVAISTNWVSPNGSAYIAIVTVDATVPYTGFGFLSVFGLGSPTFDLKHQEVSLPE